MFYFRNDEKRGGEGILRPGGCQTIGFASCQHHTTERQVHESILLRDDRKYSTIN